MRRVHVTADAPPWLDRAFQRVGQWWTEPCDAPLRLQQVTVAALPNAADWLGGLIYVSDETGGAVPAFSDGTNWRRVTDRAIVS